MHPTDNIWADVSQNRIWGYRFNLGSWEVNIVGHSFWEIPPWTKDRRVFRDDGRESDRDLGGE